MNIASSVCHVQPTMACNHKSELFRLKAALENPSNLSPSWVFSFFILGPVCTRYAEIFSCLSTYVFQLLVLNSWLSHILHLKFS